MDDQEVFKQWASTAEDKYLRSRQQELFNFVEITRLPKKIDGRSLTSLIVTSSGVAPVTTDICVKQEPHYGPERVALIEFKSETDAHLAVQRLRTAPYAASWRIRILSNPKLAEPDVE